LHGLGGKGCDKFKQLAAAGSKPNFSKQKARHLHAGLLLDDLISTP